MKFVNDYDMERWRDATRGRGDNLEAAVLILTGIACDANQHSDGWHIWPKPCNASRQLIELIERSLPRFGQPVPVHAADLRKALSPIRAFYTRQHAKTPHWPAIPPHCEGRA